MNDQSAKPKIGGILIVVAVCLWLGPLAEVSAVINDIIQLIHKGSFSLINFVFDIIGWVVSIVLLVKFTKRQRSFVKWAVWYEVFCIVAAPFIQNGWSISNVIASFIGVAISIIYISYLLRSKRVKATFIM